MIQREALLKLADALNQGVEPKDVPMAVRLRPYSAYGGVFRGLLEILPAVFPGDWEWRGDDLSLRSTEQGYASPAVCSFSEYFGLEAAEATHLLFAGRQRAEYGGKPLTMEATPSEVGANIRAFVERTGGAS